jgi:membrane protein required for colicin V production
MVWVDVAVLLVISLSAIIGLWRGLIKEAFSVVTWILAIIIALRFSVILDGPLSGHIDHPALRAAIAIAIVFTVVFILGAVIGQIAGRLIQAAGLRSVDRTLGSVFGVVRGIALVLFLVVLAGFTAFPAAGWWQDSLFLGLFQQLAVFIKAILPGEIAGLVRYG